MSPVFDDIAAVALILSQNETGATKEELPTSNLKRLDNEFAVLQTLFPNGGFNDRPSIFVQRPEQDRKRGRDEDSGSPAKRSRPDVDIDGTTGTLEDAVKKAGLTTKAVKNGKVYLSLLNNEERVAVLENLGERIEGNDSYNSLSEIAFDLRDTDIEVMDKLSAPRVTFPVVETSDLFVRQTYKDLYSTVLEDFESSSPNRRVPRKRKRIVVAGTSGIGKSAFLVYFVIRLLAESHDDSPPLLLFHTKRSEKCYVFGGRSTIRSGDIKVFEPFLNLTDTWYLVDSSQNPVLAQAKTVISASPKTLTSDTEGYKDVEKKVGWLYYMAPWNLEELKTCRNIVSDFQVVPLGLVEELYSEIGGVPRYVLERPMTELERNHRSLQEAKDSACERVNLALLNVKDPMVLLQYLAQGKETLQFSSRLIHRWPSDKEHRKYRLEWASISLRDKVADQLTHDAFRKIFKKLMDDPTGSASGLMFESFVLRAFREGGHTFELKDLQTQKSTRLIIPLKPKVNHFPTITMTKANQLWIRKICNFACVDMLLSPRDLFQVTVSKTHPVKGQQLLKLIEDLKQHHWITRSKEVRLIFVVPSHAFDGFPIQNYLTSDGAVYQKCPVDLREVKQYVLKIDVESAAQGKPLGLDLPVRRTRK